MINNDHYDQVPTKIAQHNIILYIVAKTLSAILSVNSGISVQNRMIL